MCRAPNKTQTKPGYEGEDSANTRTRTQRKANMVHLESEVSSGTEDDDNDAHVFRIDNHKSARPNLRRTITINGSLVRALIDTGADVDVLAEKDFQHVKGDLHRTTTIVTAIGSTVPLQTLGKIHAKVVFGSHQATAKFIVVKGASVSLLSYDTANQLGMLKLLCPVTDQNEGKAWKEKYPEVFSGKIGRYKGPPIRLQEDDSVKPKAVLGRRVPFHYRSRVEQKIHEFVKDGIVEPVVGGSKGWISPIVVVPTGTKQDPEKIRVCIDMTNPNKAISRERCALPSTEELLEDLNGATFFSKIDLNAAYHQIPLHEESRHLTTFSTHVGLFRFKRLNFGVNAASEIFHDIIRRCIQGIPGVKNTADEDR